MPILDIEIVGPLDETLHAGLATRLADAAGEALNSRPQGTWVKLKFVPDDHYAENAGGPPAGVRPVFITLLQAEVPEGLVLHKQAELLCAAIATTLGRPSEQVHLLVEPPAIGRIFFGGTAR